MTRTRISIAAAALALAGLTAGLATAAATGKQTDRLSYRHVNAIVLDNPQGHVHISSGSSQGVTVERTTQTLFTHATHSAYISRGVLHLSSRCHGTVCQVDYRIHTPTGVQLNITERNADVSIAGSPGDLAISNTNEGDLTIDLAKAPRQLSAHTHKGAINITIPQGAYAVTASANHGNKTLKGVTLNRHANHSIHASADNGDITINGH
jgi:hypothetical protein